jgi:tRNA dimethylallyltransferase
VIDPVSIPADRPVIIAGPTASGKSGLALAIARTQGGTVVNADALQVYSAWRILTARPADDDLASAPHALYGHVARDQPYSVGHWLREVRALLETGIRPIVVGGTGLYLTALTEGLAEVPPTPPEVRAEADRRRAAGDIDGLARELDGATRARIDLRNPARVQRAWEVLAATGTGLADWQSRPAAPLLPGATMVRLDAPPDWLNPRIERRFDHMLAEGALDEVGANRVVWDPGLPWARAIGAPDLVAFLDGAIPLAEARARALAATRQYAKRQRTWFRARMAHWTAAAPGGVSLTPEASADPATGPEA